MPSPNIFFSSDHHFFDPRFALMDRPFNSIEEMHETLIKNHNDIVGPDDIWWCLGDILHDGLKNADRADIIGRLNGRKRLILGNYDSASPKVYERYFEEIYDKYILDDLCLNHYPSRGVLDLFNVVGHVHGAWKIQRNMLNVSVDVHHFRPVSLEYVHKKIESIRSYYDVNAFAGELPQNARK